MAALAVVIILAGILGAFVFFYFVPVGLWIQAWTSGARVGIGYLIAMRLRKVSPALIVAPRIAALRAGINVTMEQLEGHYLAGGNVGLVVQALISADKADIELSF